MSDKYILSGESKDIDFQVSKDDSILQIEYNFIKEEIREKIHIGTFKRILMSVIESNVKAILYRGNSWKEESRKFHIWACHRQFSRASDDMLTVRISSYSTFEAEEIHVKELKEQFVEICTFVSKMNKSFSLDEFIIYTKIVQMLSF